MSKPPFRFSGVRKMTEARNVVQALGGEWKGNTGLAPCPICQSEGRRDQRGLSVKDSGGRTLLTCHKSGCPAPDIFTELRGRGIVQGNGHSIQRSPADIQREKAERRKKRERTWAYCYDLFSHAVPITGTLAEVYLEGRGIKAQWHKMRHTLRYHPALPHTGTKQKLPAMIARLRGPDGRATGLHRTYLKPDGSGKADLPGGAKLMLGSCGGSAVRFGPDRPVIALAEGIETALSIGVASRLTVWATLSTSGMKGLILPPPPVAEVVVIAADHDSAGLLAAEETALRLEAEGRAVSIITPQAEGMDFNDVLRGGAHG
ncbi:Toprim domain-containing protein [Aliiroseovarius halocynthiae]|nr:Toprim domain-containing protein [Aliiroseovarius halocynthiae]